MSRYTRFMLRSHSWGNVNETWAFNVYWAEWFGRIISIESSTKNTIKSEQSSIWLNWIWNNWNYLNAMWTLKGNTEWMSEFFWKVRDFLKFRKRTWFHQRFSTRVRYMGQSMSSIITVQILKKSSFDRISITISISAWNWQ